MRNAVTSIFILAGLWESRCPAQSDPFAAHADAQVLVEKMNRIIFPSIRFEGANLEEAVEYLSLKSRDLDTQETRRKWKGVHIVVNSADNKLSAPLISLDLKNVSMRKALQQVTEKTGCIYKVGPGEVVVSSRALESTEVVQQPRAKAAIKDSRTQISVQVAEIIEGKVLAPIQTPSGRLTLQNREDAVDNRSEPAPGQFVLSHLMSEAMRQTVVKGLAQKKRLTLHPVESEIVGDEAQAAFQCKGIPTMKVLVEDSADDQTIELLMTVPAWEDKPSGIGVTLWNGQTAVLNGWFPDQGSLRRHVLIFVTAKKVDTKKRTAIDSPKS